MITIDRSFVDYKNSISKFFFALSLFCRHFTNEKTREKKENDNIVTEDDPARLLHVNNNCAGSLY
jgi:hypothetical protein